MQTFLIIEPTSGRILGQHVTGAPDYAKAANEALAGPEQIAEPGAWRYLAGAWMPAALVAPTVAELLAYAAERRFAVETGGVTVAGARVATDRASQGMLASAVAYLTASGGTEVQFKGLTGFVTLSADALQAIAVAVGAHVQACFAAEAKLAADIAAMPPRVTTRAEVDAAFAALGA